MSKKTSLKPKFLMHSFPPLFLGFVFLFSSVAAGAEITEESIRIAENQADELSRQWNNDSYQNSAKLFIKASENWKKLNKPNNSAGCLYRSAEIYLKLNEYIKAIRDAEEALKISEKFGNSDQIAENASLLSLIYLRAGKIKESEAYCK